MTLLLLAPLIALVLVGAVSYALQLQRRGQRRLVGRVVDAEAPSDAMVDADPSILYFTGVHCSVCHVAQRPALASLSERVGRAVSIREVDVADDPALARRYRVLTLPTTVVLRPDHTIAAINAGFAPADTLRRQLVDAGLSLPEAAAV